MRCEERNHCQSNKCQNGAICINEATDEEPYRCECPFDQGVPTFYGKYCQFDVDECKRDPCQVNFSLKTGSVLDGWTSKESMPLSLSRLGLF